MSTLFPWVWQGYPDDRKHYRGPLGMALLNGINLAIYTAVVSFVGPLVWHFATGLYR